MPKNARKKPPFQNNNCVNRSNLTKKMNFVTILTIIRVKKEGTDVTAGEISPIAAYSTMSDIVYKWIRD
ncbi:MAG TPA: hypothetical protein DEQ14_00215, partial [Treponema sp.]|nr:hypothetical protein [Treponema sp.]